MTPYNEVLKLRLAHKNMLDRCYNINNASYDNYGARGIKVCSQWKFARQPFIKWALSHGHKMNLTLDRIDTNGDYFPENCRWVTVQEQLRNQRRNKIISAFGKSVPLVEWAEQLGINYSTLQKRLSVYGVPPEEALKAGRLNKAKIAAHGTRIKYERDGCRCAMCRECNTQRAREYRLKLKKEKSQQFALADLGLEGNPQ